MEQEAVEHCRQWHPVILDPFRREYDVHLSKWTINLNQDDDVELLWGQWLETVNTVADNTIGTTRISTHEREKAKERHKHSLVQEKNELRRKRDRATGWDREIFHSQYKKLKNRIKQSQRKHRIPRTIKDIQEEQKKDPKSY